MAQNEERMTIELTIVLPRGIPVMTFVGLSRGVEAVIKACVEAAGLPSDEVEMRIGPPGSDEDAEDGGE